MICKVIIHDFEIDRRMVYVLEDADFAAQQRCWQHGDALLDTMQDTQLFAGRQRWCDLDITHFHMMLLNILRILAGVQDEQCNYREPAVRRLIFLLCCLIDLLQQRASSVIDLLRINRVQDNLMYDYTAMLDVAALSPSPKLHLVP